MAAYRSGVSSGGCEHQLALHGSSGVVIRDDSRFECLIVFDVFQSHNDGFGS
jgi:hypothetical protein